MMAEFIKGDESELISKYQPVTTAFAVVESAEGYMLLDNKYRKLWELTGGIIEPLETPRDCVVRECMEESCQDIDGANFVGLVRLMMKKNDFRAEDRVEYAALYYCFIDSVNEFVENDEMSGLRWWKHDEGAGEGVCAVSLEMIEFVRGEIGQ